jgi:hypothetical protein
MSTDTLAAIQAAVGNIERITDLFGQGVLASGLTAPVVSALHHLLSSTPDAWGALDVELIGPLIDLATSGCDAATWDASVMILFDVARYGSLRDSLNALRSSLSVHRVLLQSLADNCETSTLPEEDTWTAATAPPSESRHFLCPFRNPVVALLEAMLSAFVERSRTASLRGRSATYEAVFEAWQAVFSFYRNHENDWSPSCDCGAVPIPGEDTGDGGVHPHTWYFLRGLAVWVCAWCVDLGRFASAANADALLPLPLLAPVLPAPSAPSTSSASSSAASFSSVPLSADYTRERQVVVASAMWLLSHLATPPVTSRTLHQSASVESVVGQLRPRMDTWPAGTDATPVAAGYDQQHALFSVVYHAVVSPVAGGASVDTAPLPRVVDVTQLLAYDCQRRVYEEQRIAATLVLPVARPPADGLDAEADADAQTDERNIATAYRPPWYVTLDPLSVSTCIALLLVLSSAPSPASAGTAATLTPSTTPSAFAQVGSEAASPLDTLTDLAPHVNRLLRREESSALMLGQQLASIVLQRAAPPTAAEQLVRVYRH